MDIYRFAVFVIERHTFSTKLIHVFPCTCSTDLFLQVRADMGRSTKHLQQPWLVKQNAVIEAT